MKISKPVMFYGANKNYEHNLNKTIARYGIVLGDVKDFQEIEGALLQKFNCYFRKPFLRMNRLEYI